jgi:hypothetical protein
VRVGRTPQEKRALFKQGYLPVMTVDTVEEANRLLALTCKKNIKGDYVAPELTEEQTLDRLEAFGQRLDEAYKRYIKRGILSL